VQVDPIKPKLKPTGTKRLKLEDDNLLSNLLQFAFKFAPICFQIFSKLLSISTCAATPRRTR